MICPICLNAGGGAATSIRTGPGFRYTCDICGNFELTRSANQTLADKAYLPAQTRVAICHMLREIADGDGTIPVLETDWLEGARMRPPVLPRTAEQAANAIRWIGNYVQRNGARVSTLPLSFFASIGAPSASIAIELANELVTLGKISVLGGGDKPNVGLGRLGLTLQGWKDYEDEKLGLRSGKFGFVAMKFGDPILEPFIHDVVKPAVQKLGLILVDMRDVARPGIIDNIMRQTIRDSAFLLVDLTHDNAGAYWEAGFAEGLGKPVLYLCEQQKFDQKKTHFDTNHCTTVTWGGSKSSEQFSKELLATLRGELKLPVST